MLYTSGTTGRPKGVAPPKTSAVARRALADRGRVRPRRGQLHLCTGPLYHAAPLAFSLSAPLIGGVGDRADGRAGTPRQTLRADRARTG